LGGIRKDYAMAMSDQSDPETAAYDKIVPSIVSHGHISFVRGVQGSFNNDNDHHDVIDYRENVFCPRMQGEFLISRTCPWSSTR
jgi:hypothetical protein